MAQSFLFFCVLALLCSFLLADRFYPRNLIVAEAQGVVNNIPTAKTVLKAKANFILDKKLDIHYHKNRKQKTHIKGKYPLWI